MVTGIDHLVIAVPDLDAAAHELEQRVGLSISGGGRHEGSGTANRIAFLADGSYLELIAVDDRDAAAASPVGAAAIRQLDRRGPGLATFALAEDHLQDTTANLVANGSSLGDVRPGSRRRPDGELVEWSSAFPAELGLDSPPFLIQHAHAGAEWGPEAVAERRAFAHPIGSPVILARLDIATPEPPSLAARYLRDLGIEFWAVSDLAVAAVGSHVMRLVPSREMDMPAVVTLGAEIAQPQSIDALGIRIAIEATAVRDVLSAQVAG
jgi:Glyoxalase-like domain